MLGMRVTVKFTGERFSDITNPSSVYRNVTEIHYQYRQGMIAFESDIHGAGTTWPLKDIREFEALAEKEQAETYDDHGVCSGMQTIAPE